MILGVGIDMIELARLERSLKRQGSRFVDRIAHPVELKTQPGLRTRRAAEYWGGRFAAKEAFAKALGTGLGATVPLRSVGVENDAAGKPTLAFAKALQRTLRRRGVSIAHVSITHTAKYASAVVILEGKSR